MLRSTPLLLKKIRIDHDHKLLVVHLNHEMFIVRGYLRFMFLFFNGEWTIDEIISEMKRLNPLIKTSELILAILWLKKKRWIRF